MLQKQKISGVYVVPSAKSPLGWLAFLVGLFYVMIGLISDIAVF